MAVHVHQSCCCAGNGGAPQAASAADPGTTLPSIPAFAHAAQGPAPVFAFGPAGADMHAGPPACDEAPEAQDAMQHLAIYWLEDLHTCTVDLYISVCMHSVHAYT